MTATGKNRAAAHAARMKKEGRVKVSVSMFVPAEKAEKVKEAGKKAMTKALS